MATTDIYDPSAMADDEIAFDYLKAPDFRMVWADGAVGGELPSGMIHFVLYGERPSIPRRQVYKIDETGKLGNRVNEKTISRSSMVRELICDVVIEPTAAIEMAEFIKAIAKNAIEAAEQDEAHEIDGTQGGPEEKE